MDVPGCRFHPLTGEHAGEDATDVMLEDYD